MIVSDTKSTPNAVFVFNTTNNTSTTLSIVGATAADFSPDNLKAYIAAGSTLYVFSTLTPLKTIPLGGPGHTSVISAGGWIRIFCGRRSLVDHGAKDLHRRRRNRANRCHPLRANLSQDAIEEPDTWAA